MPFVERNGASLWYAVGGDDGDVITTIGGDVMAHDQFHFAYPSLIERHRVVSWDFRGIGASDRKSGVSETVDTKVEDLRAVLDAAGVQRTHLWAAATGTYTAILFAHRYPERVGAIIHYGQCKPTAGADRMFRILAAVHEEFDWPTACRHMVHLYAPQPEFMAWTIAVYVANASAEWLTTYRAELDADITAEMAEVKAPMLVMLGDQGPLGAYTSYGSGWEATRACQPNAELEVIEGGTGTYYMVDAAERAARRALDFFEVHPIFDSQAPVRHNNKRGWGMASK